MKMAKKKRIKNKENLDVGGLFRKNAYVIENGEKVFFSVSPSAIHEYILRMRDGIEINAPQIAEITHRDGRKRITVTHIKGKDDVSEPVYDDITQHFGHMDSRVTYGVHRYCSKCLKKIEKEENK